MQNLDTLNYFGYPIALLHQSRIVYSGEEKWYYLNDFEEKATVKGKQVLWLVRKREIDVFKKEILENPEWMEMVRIKALTRKSVGRYKWNWKLNTVTIRQEIEIIPACIFLPLQNNLFGPFLTEADHLHYRSMRPKGERRQNDRLGVLF